MSESLWESDEPPKVKKHRTRAAKPMQAVTQTYQPVPVARPSFTKREPPRDYAMEDAIRVLAPILHPDEIVKYRDIIEPASDPRVQAGITDWRQRHGFS